MNYDFYLFPSYKTEEKIKKSKILAPFAPNFKIYTYGYLSTNIDPSLKNDNLKAY